jgi:hypothetical protein
MIPTFNRAARAAHPRNAKAPRATNSQGFLNPVQIRGEQQAYENSIPNTPF